MKQSFIIVIIIIALCLGHVRSAVYHNLASLSRMSAVQSNTASDRQIYLKKYVLWLTHSFDQKPIIEQSLETNDFPMIRSFYIAQYYRIHGKIKEALVWYMYAAQSTILPLQQAAIMPLLPKFLDHDGTILVDDFTDIENWHTTTNTNITAIKYNSDKHGTQITFQNNREIRDILGYTFSSTTPFPTAYHNRLAIRIKSEDNAYLSIETVEAGKRYRRLNYSQIQTEWETVYLPLTEENLSSLTISFSEPDNTSYDQVEINVWLDWVRLELTD